jgi:hypothetical protein
MTKSEKTPGLDLMVVLTIGEGRIVKRVLPSMNLPFGMVGWERGFEQEQSL